jgi:hypothetical protein
MRTVEKVMLKFISLASGMTIAVSAIALNAQATTTNVASSLVRESTANLYAQVIFNRGNNNLPEQSGNNPAPAQNSVKKDSGHSLDPFNQPAFRSSQPENYPNFNNNYYSRPNPANIPSSIDRQQNTSNTAKPVKRKNNYVKPTYDRLPGKASYTPIDRLGGKSCGKNYQFRNGKCESVNN